ncbi:MAG TPA: hypothetical protein VFQ31_07860 [Methyloceanibacter sp.]|nr:hypothetical protein [Methyloceanibacter sp.]
MLTRVLFALLLICGLADAAAAEEAKVLALGLADHAVTQEELEKGEALKAPKFNTPAVAYVLAGDLKKGDTVEVELFNEDKSLMRNMETAGEDGAKLLVQAGKRGVPAGGWPEGNYSAKATITRDGKALIEQSSKPVAFE